MTGAKVKAPFRPITKKDPPASWAASQTGPREQNEDDYGRADQYTAHYDWQNRGCLYVLADGMGGLDGGKEAAQVAVRSVLQSYRGNGRSQDVEPNLVQALQNANQQIYNAGARQGRRMGSTLVACVLKDGKATISHAGDSRVYQLSTSGALQRLTRDHLYATEVLGIQDDDEAKRSPEGNKVTRALGKDPELQVDRKVVDYSAGDRFLLCSDGLSEALSPDEICEGLKKPTPEQAVNTLCSMADGRLHDNATAIVVFASGNKIRRKKTTKQIAVYAATVVLVCGLGLAGYLGVRFWLDHRANLIAKDNKTEDKSSDSKPQGETLKPSPSQSMSNDEDRAKAEEAKARAEEAKSRAEEARAKADEARQKAIEAKAKADEATARAKEANFKAADQAKAEAARVAAQKARGDQTKAEADAKTAEAKADELKAKANQAQAKTDPTNTKADDGKVKTDEASAKAQGAAKQTDPNATQNTQANPVNTGNSSAANADSSKTAKKQPQNGENSLKGATSQPDLASASAKLVRVVNKKNRTIEFWADTDATTRKTRVESGTEVDVDYSNLRNPPTQVCWSDGRFHGNDCAKIENRKATILPEKNQRQAKNSNTVDTQE